MKLLSFLCWWRRQTPSSLSHLVVVMYTRPGCHLCAEAWEQLRRQQGRYHYSLEQRDVDADPELAAQYGEWVPVVTVQGKVRFRGGVNPVLLQRLLEKEGP